MRAFEDETLMGRNLADTARLFCESNGQILFGTPDQYGLCASRDCFGVCVCVCVCVRND